MIKEQKEVVTDENLDDIYFSYLTSKIEEGEKNIKEGNVMTLEELKDFIDKLVGRKWR